MSEIERLRGQAAHLRQVAKNITDPHDQVALRAVADELERKATELELRKLPLTPKS